LQEIERRMQVLLHQEAGAKIDRYYYSTELAQENSSRRKPAPGMLLEAARDFQVSLTETVFAGDSMTDIQAGQAAGVGAAILLLSGGLTSYRGDETRPVPDFVFPTLSTAVDWILEQVV
jgi:D-glycero-D-manno-heptose 1,7-bisphosphate phosphatase